MMIGRRGTRRRRATNVSQVPTTGIDSMIAVGDPQAGAGEQVVGQRVAGEALEDAEPEQQRRR